MATNAELGREHRPRVDSDGYYVPGGWSITSGTFGSAAKNFFTLHWGRWLKGFDGEDGRPHPWLGTGGSLGRGFRTPLAIMGVGMWMASLGLALPVIGAAAGGSFMQVLILAAASLVLVVPFGYVAWCGFAQYRWGRRQHLRFRGQVGECVIVYGVPAAIIVYVLVRTWIDRR